MQQFEHISPQQTWQKLVDKQVNVVDIRDINSFNAGHIPGAFHLTNESLSQFMQQHSTDEPVVVCCYHGISSQQAAQYLIGQGFAKVYSMDGGFEAWRGSFEYDTSAG